MGGGGGGGGGNEEMAQKHAQKEEETRTIMSQILSPEARERRTSSFLPAERVLARQALRTWLEDLVVSGM